MESDSDSSVESQFTKCNAKFKTDFVKLMETPNYKTSNVVIVKGSTPRIKNSKKMSPKKTRAAVKNLIRRNLKNKNTNVYNNCSFDPNAMLMHIRNSTLSKRETDIVVVSDEDEANINGTQQPMTYAMLEQSNQFHPTETVNHSLIEPLENFSVDSDVIDKPIKNEVEEYSIGPVNNTVTPANESHTDSLPIESTINFQVPEDNAIASTSNEDRITELSATNSMQAILINHSNDIPPNSIDYSVNSINTINDTSTSSSEMDRNCQISNDEDIMKYINSIGINENDLIQEVEDRHTRLNRQLGRNVINKPTVTATSDFDVCENHELSSSTANDSVLIVNTYTSNNNDSDVEIIEEPRNMPKRRKATNILDIEQPCTSFMNAARPRVLRSNRRNQQMTMRNMVTSATSQAVQVPITGMSSPMSPLLILPDILTSPRYQNIPSNTPRIVLPGCSIPPVIPPEVPAEREEEAGPAKVLHDCCICLQPLSDSISSTICGHVFCTPCIIRAVQTAKCCPTCRTRLTKAKIHPLFI